MIVEARHISREFTVESGAFKQRMRTVRALDDVGFSLEEFSTLGIVGESGSGKTTLAKIILRLIAPTSGEVVFDDRRIVNFRKDVQIVFQNPYNSLNPLMTVFETLSEPLLIHAIVPRKIFKERCVELLRSVGLTEEALDRRPAQFSGGQRQRICIARSLACGPKLIVLDEPISSLDLTIQAGMLDLFLRLKRDLKLTYIFISHNLAVIRLIADTILVMKDGVVVEQGNAESIFARPQHPYTRKLLGRP